ncbi:hypothetical protein IWQ60_001743 [Tieghemiomyces parasiticus]|uniref:Uncharacterized protein n=1 Tax=Tieghemiomyces parasiticus TaxID=78921 RepID=A0A9W8AK62_9FUNG|nr:hypothetical protein IWQ60_001743 [Tieghemiomyces parasiticus]
MLESTTVAQGHILDELKHKLALDRDRSGATGEQLVDRLHEEFTSLLHQLDEAAAQLTGEARTRYESAKARLEAADRNGAPYDRLKVDAQYVLEDVRDLAREKTGRAQHVVGQKAQEAKHYVGQKAYGAKQFADEKVHDAQYYADQRAQQATNYAGEKLQDARYYAGEKAEEAQMYAGEKAGDLKDYAAGQLYSAADYAGGKFEEVKGAAYDTAEAIKGQATSYADAKATQASDAANQAKTVATRAGRAGYEEVTGFWGRLGDYLPGLGHLLNRHPSANDLTRCPCHRDPDYHHRVGPTGGAIPPAEPALPACTHGAWLGGDSTSDLQQRVCNQAPAFAQRETTGEGLSPEVYFNQMRALLDTQYQALREAALPGDQHDHNKVAASRPVLRLGGGRLAVPNAPVSAFYTALLGTYFLVLLRRLSNHRRELDVRRRLLHGSVAEAAGTGPALNTRRASRDYLPVAQASLAFERHFSALSGAVTRLAQLAVVAPVTAVLLLIMELNGYARTLLHALFMMLVVGAAMVGQTPSPRLATTPTATTGSHSESVETSPLGSPSRRTTRQSSSSAKVTRDNGEDSTSDDDNEKSDLLHHHHYLHHHPHVPSAREVLDEVSTVASSTSAGQWLTKTVAAVALASTVYTTLTGHVWWTCA